MAKQLHKSSLYGQSAICLMTMNSDSLGNFENLRMSIWGKLPHVADKSQGVLVVVCFNMKRIAAGMLDMVIRVGNDQ